MTTPEYEKVFQFFRHDGDHLGNMKPGALLRCAQQIATEHAESAGLTDAVYTETHTAYVLAKIALHLARPVRVDELLTVITQPERTKRAVNKRITRVRDEKGEEVALLDSRWVLIDTEKRAILRTRPAQFDESWAQDVPCELPMKMTKAKWEDCTPLGQRTAAYSLCDMNGHLNNTRYADIICDALPMEVWDVGTVQDMLIFYHREVPRGQTFELACARTGDDQWYVAARREGQSAFEASVTFRPL